MSGFVSAFTEIRFRGMLLFQEHFSEEGNTIRMDLRATSTVKAAHAVSIDAPAQEKAAIEKEKTELTARIDAIEQDKAAIATVIAGLTAEKAGLTAQPRPESLAERVGLPARITGLDARITGLDARITGLDASQREIDARIRGLDERITILVQEQVKKRADDAQATREAAPKRPTEAEATREAPKQRPWWWCVNPDIFSMAGCVAGTPQTYCAFLVFCAAACGWFWLGFPHLGVHGNAVWDACKIVAASLAQGQARLTWLLWGLAMIFALAVTLFALFAVRPAFYW